MIWDLLTNLITFADFERKFTRYQNLRFLTKSQNQSVSLKRTPKNQVAPWANPTIRNPLCNLRTVHKQSQMLKNQRSAQEELAKATSRPGGRKLQFTMATAHLTLSRSRKRKSVLSEWARWAIRARRKWAKRVVPERFWKAPRSCFPKVKGATMRGCYLQIWLE